MQVSKKMNWDNPNGCGHPLTLIKRVDEPITMTSLSYECECGAHLSELQYFARQPGDAEVSSLHEKNCYYCGKDINHVGNHSHSIREEFGETVFGGHCICGHHARTIVLKKKFAGSREILTILELDLIPHGIYSNITKNARRAI